MSRFPRWHFRSMDAGEVQVDPVHDEFFKAQDLADALVRESIQNSLDARLPRSRSPVRIRFRFAAGEHALPAEGVREYFDGLEPHLDAFSHIVRTALPRRDAPVPFLLIEDFGTRGLTGDPSIDPELSPEKGEGKNDFFYFWRNVGRSNKGEVDRGRWGLGKAVFTVASRIRTVFGFTRRADDDRALLLGQSVLKTHILGDTRFYPYGFCAHPGPGGLPLPIEDRILLNRFHDDFRLDRGESGLSIVIPYFREDELSFSQVMESALRQYFYPILRGDLVVEIASDTHLQRIDSATIASLAPPGSAVARLCALTRWSLAQNDQTTIVLPKREGGAPRWDESVFDEKQLAALRSRFATGERLAFRVPILVKRKHFRAASSSFDVYLEADEALRKPEHHFIRRGITIPEVRGNGDKAARALIVIDDQALSTFLGDAENPAHSDWSERADKIRTQYDYGPWTLRFVKNSAAFLTSLLARPPAGRVRSFLADIFWVDAPGDEAPEASMTRIPIRGTGVTTSATGEGDATARGNGLTIARIAGGFTIKSAANPALVGRPLHAEVAYRVRAGNPFRKHSPFDFDLTQPTGITTRAEGVAVRPVAANAFELTPETETFHLSMKGFDTRRDLIVRVVERNDAAETELH